jgi:predicted secreted protein
MTNDVTISMTAEEAAALANLLNEYDFVLAYEKAVAPARKKTVRNNREAINTTLEKLEATGRLRKSVKGGKWKPAED